MQRAFRTIADNNRTMAGPHRPPTPSIHAAAPAPPGVTNTSARQSRVMLVGRMSGLGIFVQDSGYTSQIKDCGRAARSHGNLCRFYLAFATPWNPCRRDRVLSHGNGMGPERTWKRSCCCVSWWGSSGCLLNFRRPHSRANNAARPFFFPSDPAFVANG